jgi:hypothetical protein
MRSVVTACGRAWSTPHTWLADLARDWGLRPKDLLGITACVSLLAMGATGVWLADSTGARLLHAALAGIATAQLLVVAIHRATGPLTDARYGKRTQQASITRRET